MRKILVKIEFSTRTWRGRKTLFWISIHVYKTFACFVDNSHIHCNFEDGSSEDGDTIFSDTCRFNHDTSQLEKWVKAMGIDNTYNKGMLTNQ